MTAIAARLHFTLRRPCPSGRNGRGCYPPAMSRRGSILFISLSIIWGLPYLFIKVAVAELDPAVTVFARTLPAAAILLAWSAYRGVLRANLKFWPTALGFAVVEMVFPWWLISRAEMEISSGLTGLLLATVPLFGVLIAYFRGDRSSLRQLAGLGIGIVGVALLVGVDPADGEVLWLPVAMVLISAVGYALGPVVINRTLAVADSATIIGMALAGVSLLYLPVVAPRWPYSVPSAEVIWALVVLTLVCTVAAFLVFFALIDEIGPVRATVVTYVNPAVAIVLGVLFLQEQLTTGILLGFPMVLAGSWLASRH